MTRHNSQQADDSQLTPPPSTEWKKQLYLGEHLHQAVTGNGGANLLRAGGDGEGHLGVCFGGGEEGGVWM